MATHPSPFRHQRPALKAFHPAWGAVFVISLLMVTAGSLVKPASLPPIAFDLWDKAQHALAFGWLTAAGLMAWRHPRLAAPLGVALAAWGGVIELLQAASGHRQGDWADLTADVVGIALVLTIHRLMRTRDADRSG